MQRRRCINCIYWNKTVAMCSRFNILEDIGACGSFYKEEKLRRKDMDESYKEKNLETLREIISEAEVAIRNIKDDDIEEVQQNFMRIESTVQDLEI